MTHVSPLHIAMHALHSAQQAKKLFIACVLVFIAVAITGCSPDDAQAAKAAATALKTRVDSAINMYAELIATATIEPQKPEEELIREGVAGGLIDAKAANWEPDLKALRIYLADRDPRKKIKEAVTKNTQQVSLELKRIESTAADYETAWPLGSEQFVCLKENIFNLTKNLRNVAISFDPGAPRYTEFSIDAKAAQTRYLKALRAGDGTSAAATLQAMRQVFRAEAKANADVQAAFAAAAQSSADLYTAIESIDTLTFADALKIVQRYAPGLTQIDDASNSDAIANKLGVTLGKIQSNAWLSKFSENAIPRTGIKCKTPA
ncbi:MAG: hypothetical protein V4772_25970 [Pseudomonadota bacterium]